MYRDTCVLSLTYRWPLLIAVLSKVTAVYLKKVDLLYINTMLIVRLLNIELVSIAFFYNVPFCGTTACNKVSKVRAAQKFDL